MTIASGKPEFYLCSGDTYPTIGPRACYVQRSLSTPEGDEIYLLVKIVPRLRWKTRLGMIDTDELIIHNRRSDSLYPAPPWPGWVNGVQILNDDIKRTGIASPEDLRHIFMGHVFPTAEEAEQSLAANYGTQNRDSWI